MTNLLLTATLIAAAVATVACALEPAPAVPAPTATRPATALTVTSAGSCLDAAPPSPRPRDAVAHVYDTAVHSYLHQHASGIGRELQGDEDQKALAVTDDAVYRLCIQGPENCLREQLAQADDKTDTLRLLKTKGAYAYGRARRCLIRGGALYRGAGRPETYDERIAVHLVGAVLPVGTLRDTDYYGEAGPERLRRAEANWWRCYSLISGEPPALDAIAKRVEADLLTTIDCSDGETRNQLGGKRPADETAGAGTVSDRKAEWTPSTQINDVGEMSGHAGTEEATFGRGGNGRAGVYPVGPWYDCDDALTPTAEHIGRLVKAVPGDYVELLDCSEAFSVSE